MTSVPLLCHASTPAPFVRSLSVQKHSQNGRMTLRYDLEGQIARLRIPAQGSGHRRDGLWRHTCFEAFLKPQGEPGYFELNLAPSGDWAAYRFDAYRAGMAPASIEPSISCTRTPSIFQLTAAFDMPAPLGAARLAIAAVIEDDEGRLSYWALAHPPGKPDFHHDDGFVLDA